MENNINTIFYNSNSVTMNYLPGEKWPGLKPDIQLYKVEDEDKSDKREESQILFKIGSSIEGSNKIYRIRYILLSGYLTINDPLW